MMFFTLTLALAGLSQLPGALDRIGQAAGRFQELRITDEEEVRIGEEISGRIRTRYGVVQDASVHRYVALVGTVAAQRSSRPGLAYRFIVLDTDGVNAFAAPGGFIHVTRGALALMSNEAELAGVLAHEIAHVSGRHAIGALRKERALHMAAGQQSLSSDPELFNRVTDRCFDIVLAGFGRSDELDADDHGFAFATAAGYEASGLARFLVGLKARNTQSQARHSK